jgi:hydrogenase maturation protein HypF
MTATQRLPGAVQAPSPAESRSGAGPLAIRILIRGLVQGVGFRPFIHNLATSLDLCGFVLNSSRGVVIEVESPDPRRLDRFVHRIRRELPPLARIEHFDVTPMAPEGHGGFTIRESLEDQGHYVLISPDIATCVDCQREMSDPSDRRYQYPFVNCTNCGPRYTIIRDIPYDRPKTTMADFLLCEACRSEYEDPGDRRFHAQPIACPHCGPSLWLVPSPGATHPPLSEIRGPLEALHRARELLRDGRIVALRGLGGFHIACDATCHAAVARLREAKRRSNKPFAVMCRDLETVRRWTRPTSAEETALQTVRKPICLIPIRDEAVGLSPLVAPGNRYLGVMLPYTPLHQLLFQDGLEALIMTSGNWSEEPIIASNDEAVERLAPLVDAFLLHNREIFMRTDDSVVRAFRGEERVIRRARGYVPTPIDLGTPLPEVLGCGGELKHTFCLIKDRFAILSQHIGDLENMESMAFFQETLKNLLHLYRVRPRAIAHDLHPRYLSTQWAEEQGGLVRIGVQHHHAHIVSCMAEHQLHGPVIGVAFDGTGYGEDGNVWGGEILVADRASYRRAAHLRYVPMPGGEAAIREPWRMALSHLVAAFGEPVDWSPWDRELEAAKIQNVLRLVHTGDYSPLTSSAGRLFDAVSSILGIRHSITFEGEAAMELEMRSHPEAEGEYPFDIQGESPLIVDPGPTIRALWNERKKGVPLSIVGGRFHRSVAAMVAAVCGRLRAREALDRVCLSGGVFQNMLLLGHTVEALEVGGFQVFVHRQVPTNDGGISLGQAVVGGTRMGAGAP